MKLTYTDIAILSLGFMAFYYILKSLGLKWRIEHIEQARRRRRANENRG